MPETHPKPSDYPIDNDWALKPTNAYLLQSSTNYNKIAQVVDISGTDVISQYNSSISKEILARAQVLAKEAHTNATVPFLTMHRRAWFSSHIQFNDAADAAIAELNVPIFKHGTWRFGFPPLSEHSKHEIEMKSAGHNDEIFIKDDIIFFWELKGHMAGKLYQVSNGKRIQVGEFAAAPTYNEECVLMLDTRHIDEVVAILSCVALLSRIDSLEWTWGEVRTLPWAVPF
ncbi:hypothetical protein GQ53DRAFT_9726 [Thozetella sp. PMI_491]|nr:hypothetical protein GQ53DRAFT_9726 [Thozetella sp. PMI_491]